jgi:SAM-dependent methyltransferase
MAAERTAGQWLGIDWRSPHATHADHVAVGVAAGIEQEVLARRVGKAEPVREVPRMRFVDRQRSAAAVAPRVGRFYPPSFLQGLETARPFRVLAATADWLCIDPSPPLAGRTLAPLAAPLLPGLAARQPVGVIDPVAALLRAGVGFQAAMEGGDTDFGLGSRLTRADEHADADFYASPRLVHHLDAAARRLPVDRHARLLGDLPAGAPVLDLMSSWATQLPGNTDLALTGLGMNADELAANPQLSDRVVHDLNAEPRLPFADRAFAAALCSLSVEYLVEPLAVFAELARVLRPGAALVVSWTERWFPPKAHALWSELHPYERVALVVDCLRLSGGWRGIATESYRGLQRPVDDRYAGRLPEADPIYLLRAIADG